MLAWCRHLGLEPRDILNEIGCETILARNHGPWQSFFGDLSQDHLSLSTCAIQQAAQRALEDARRRRALVAKIPPEGSAVDKRRRPSATNSTKVTPDGKKACTSQTVGGGEERDLQPRSLSFSEAEGRIIPGVLSKHFVEWGFKGKGGSSNPLVPYFTSSFKMLVSRQGCETPLCFGIPILGQSSYL